MSTVLPSHKPRVRIIACQGAVQLASAISAMWATSGKTSSGSFVENHLVIHDLSAPEGKDIEFAACIARLARAVENWKSIQYVSLPEILEIQKKHPKDSLAQGRALTEQLELHDCDELFTGQNDKFCPAHLRRTFRGARHICFGDGIALNFTNSYYRPKEYRGTQSQLSWTTRLKQRTKSLMRELRGRLRNLRNRESKRTSAELPPFDLHCLLLKNLFDQKLRKVCQLEAAVFRELFVEFGKDFPTQAPVAHEALMELNNHNGQNVVLLTSNFSETGRMSLAGELTSYQELLGRLPTGDDVALIIKPHPRDSYEKIQQLAERASKTYRNVITLNDPWAFHLPFESLYTRYLQPSARPTSVATVSSACISLEYLYGQPCELGFGREIVEREFVSLWEPLRQIHEADIAKIVQQIRRDRAKGLYSSRAA